MVRTLALLLPMVRQSLLCLCVHGRQLASCGVHVRLRVASAGTVLQLVELKNGETYNGHLVSCDNYMNINLREVTLTAQVLLRLRRGFTLRPAG